MKRNPLFEEAINRNVLALKDLHPDSPGYQECKSKIDKYRHDLTIELLTDISKPKKIEKYIAVISTMAVVISLFFGLAHFFGWSLAAPNKVAVPLAQNIAVQDEKISNKGQPEQTKPTRTKQESIYKSSPSNPAEKALRVGKKKTLESPPINKIKIDEK